MSNNAPTDHHCPPLMEDGRYLTDFRPSCIAHHQMMATYGYTNAFQFKEFMQDNAHFIHAHQTAQHRAYHACNCPCSHPVSEPAFSTGSHQRPGVNNPCVIFPNPNGHP